MCELIFINQNHGRIVILSESVAAIMDSNSQIRSKDNEAGGILIGERRGRHFYVSSITEPQKNDVRNRYKFIRNIEGHIDTAESVFSESRGYSNYLGEWHTHPEDKPTPSAIDIKSWIENAKRIEEDTLAFIQGKKTIYAALILACGDVIELSRVSETPN